jgi:hemolysin activation/secretion protein
MGLAMKRFLLSAALSAIAAPACAQVLPPRLAVPDAGQVLQPPSRLPALKAPAPAAPQVPALPNALKLHFTNVHVAGAHVVPAQMLIAPFARLEGRDVTAAELKAALDKVDAVYAAAGYPLGRAFIPAQRMKRGTLMVKVVEGYVGSIHVTADDAATKALVAQYADVLLTEKPLTRKTLERVILLLQDLPGVTLGSQFTRLDPATGAAHLELTANVRVVTIGLSLNNRSGFGNLPLQPYAVATLNNLLGLGDQFIATALLSPKPSEYGFYSLQSSAAIGGGGLRAGLDASYAQALDDVSLRPFSVKARTTQLAAKARYPLIRATDENLTVQARIYYTNARYSLAYGSLSGVIAHDGVLAGELSADYGRSLSRTLAIGTSLRLVQGLGSTAPEPHTRLRTIPAFTKVRAEARGAWQPLTDVTLKLSAMAQVSPNSLVSSEEVAFGGLMYGRGFQPAEITGDKGIGLSFQPEYRVTISPQWNVTPYLLADYAKVWNKRGDLQGSSELVSAGGGLRLDYARLGELTLEMAKPLNRRPLDRADKSWRFYAGFEVGMDKIGALIAETL